MMNLAIAATVFPIIFLGELPDKTMFAARWRLGESRPPFGSVQPAHLLFTS
jgi:hypothetical protein